MTTSPALEVDVLCAGQASFDLVFAVDRQPGGNEKIAATGFTNCGGGPAANAAITVARLGGKAAFAGYLDNTVYGETHYRELRREGINCNLVVRGERPTPLSAILVKPDGSRTVVNHRVQSVPLRPEEIDLDTIVASVMLFDGHEPLLGEFLAKQAKQQGIATVLDAGSLHAGTRTLAPLVDYLVCSEAFALAYANNDDPRRALASIVEFAPYVVVTLGERGLLWKSPEAQGKMEALQVKLVDTTGAGDVFHGALCLAVARRTEWREALHYASAAAALSCTKLGARPAIPTAAALQSFLASH